MIDRDAVAADAPGLAAMAAAAFVATFGHLYAAADLDAFLGEAFGPAGLPAQIGDPAYAIRVALDDGGAIVGYAKLGPCGLPPPASPADAELKQLYVADGWHGRGVARRLLDWALARARADGARRMALSVWVDNHRAKAFYARAGFVEVGRNPFRVGDQVDDDRIWSLDL